MNKDGRILSKRLQFVLQIFGKCAGVEEIFARCSVKRVVLPHGKWEVAMFLLAAQMMNEAGKCYSVCEIQRYHPLNYKNKNSTLRFYNIIKWAKSEKPVNILMRMLHNS